MIGFGKYTKKKEPTAITTLTDNRLVKIDPQEPGFFDGVLNFKSTDEDINMFIEAVDEVKKADIKPFYRAIYDPSEVGTNMIAFQKEKNAAVGHSYNWWVETASKMVPIKGRKWHLATEYQYYAFLVWLINQLVKNGKSVEYALNQVVLDSEEIGHYFNSEKSTKGKKLEFTGSRCICGICDLANTCKILDCSNSEVGGFWLAGGRYDNFSSSLPLAYLNHDDNIVNDDNHSVGLLVLY